MKRNSRSASGFTLIEMLVVVLVIGVLVSFAWPEYQATMARTKMASLIPKININKAGKNEIINNAFSTLSFIQS